MTFNTGDIGMHADHGEAGDVMIKANFLKPGRRSVARFAASLELATVHVIVGMASATSSR